MSDRQKQTNFIIFSGISLLIWRPVIVVVVAAAFIAFIVDVGVVIIGVWKFNHYAAAAASAIAICVFFRCLVTEFYALNMYLCTHYNYTALARVYAIRH